MPTITGDNFYIDKHTLQFRTGTSSLASIGYDKTDESISIANAGTGQISIGDAGGDIYIGDGSIETDIIFEQNGAIRALANKTLKLGQGDSDVKVEAQNFLVTGDAGFSGDVTINGNPVMTGANPYDEDTLQTVTDRGATTTNSISITSTSAGALAVDTDTLYVDASSDRVGINEDSVDATLHLTNVAGGVVNQKFERAGVSAWRLGIPNGETYFAFDDSNDDLSTPEMVITTDGEVGIGTQVPDSILHLDSDGATVLTIESDNDNNDEGDEAAIHLLTDGGLRTAAIAGGNATYETSTSGNFNALNLQSYVIRFHTAPSQDFDLATEKMRLTPAGNLGIGTTNPQYNLEIYSGDLGLGVSSTGTAKLVLEGDIDNVGDVGSMDASIELLHDAGAYGYRISTENWGGVTALNFDHNKNSVYTNVLHLGTGGNVGIGTNDPSRKLEVDGDVAVYDSLQFFDNSSTPSVSAFIHRPASNELALGTNSNERIRIDSAGYVGIGTTNPARNLSVASSTTNALIQLANSTTTYAADNGLEIFVSDNDAGIVNRENGGYLRFDTNNVERIRILANGNVGIGVQRPLLHRLSGQQEEIVATNSSEIRHCWNY